MGSSTGPSIDAADAAELRQRLRHLADTAPVLSVAAALEITENLSLEKDATDPTVARHVLTAVVKFAECLPAELDRALSATAGSDIKAALAQASTAAAAASAKYTTEVLDTEKAGAHQAKNDEDPPKNVYIRIKQALTGEALVELQATAETSIHGLKRQIAELPGIQAPPGRLRLLHGGTSGGAAPVPLDNSIKVLALTEGEGELGSSADVPLELLLIRIQDHDVRRVDSDSPEAQSYDRLFKLILVGEAQVGKSSILLAYRGDAFNPSDPYRATIGVEFGTVSVVANETTKLKLQIWDTAGQERFRAITAAYYRGAHGIFLVFDVTCRSSFESLDRFMDDIPKHAGDKVAKVLVGNKTDLPDQREVTREEAEAAAARLGLRYFEVSVARGDVEDPFTCLMGQLLDQSEPMHMF